MAKNSWLQIWSLSQTRRFSELISHYWRYSLLARLLGRGWHLLSRRSASSAGSSNSQSDLGP